MNEHTNLKYREGTTLIEWIANLHLQENMRFNVRIYTFNVYFDEISKIKIADIKFSEI